MPGRIKIDEADQRILNALQEDGSLSIAALAEIVHMSQNACWRRMKRLEDEGVIRKRVALLDMASVGLDLIVFINIRTTDHSEDWLNHFASVVKTIPEVIEFYRLTGDTDYLLKLKVENMPAFYALYKQLIASINITDVTTSFALEEIKYTTAVPIKLMTPD
jgi:Lrp/AsnC family transcriptional regulator